MSNVKLHCQYCLKDSFTTEEAINHHISLKPDCKRKQAEAIRRLVSERDPLHNPYDPEFAGRGSPSPPPFDDFGLTDDEDLAIPSNWNVDLNAREVDTNGLFPPNAMEVDVEKGDITEEEELEPEIDGLPKPASFPYAVPYPGAARIYGKAACAFEKRRLNELKRGEAGWGLFKDEKHHQLAEWILTSGLSNKKLDELLATEVVSESYYVLLTVNSYTSHLDAQIQYSVEKVLRVLRHDRSFGGGYRMEMPGLLDTW